MGTLQRMVSNRLDVKVRYNIPKGHLVATLLATVASAVAALLTTVASATVAALLEALLAVATC